MQVKSAILGELYFIVNVNRTYHVDCHGLLDWSSAGWKGFPNVILSSLPLKAGPSPTFSHGSYALIRGLDIIFNSPHPWMSSSPCVFMHISICLTLWHAILPLVTWKKRDDSGRQQWHWCLATWKHWEPISNLGGTRSRGIPEELASNPPKENMKKK